MRRDTTSGLASAYQLVYGTARSELGMNLLDTSGVAAFPVSVVATERELSDLLEGEIVQIRISAEHEELAFYLLSRVSQFRSLPNHVYELARSDVRALIEAGIPYEVVG